MSTSAHRAAEAAARSAARNLPYGPFIPPAATVGFNFYSEGAYPEMKEAGAYRHALRMMQEARPLPPKFVRRRIVSYMRYASARALRAAKKEAVRNVLFYAEREALA
jgi:hypothetical protein